MLVKIFGEKGIPKVIDKAVVTFFAEHFWKAVTSSYGETLYTVSYDTSDYKMLRSLQENVYQFAGAKNYQQMKQLSTALVDDDGKLRTFAQFKQAAAEINTEFVTTWMKPEYEMAVASGQMGATWARIEENREVLPLMQFDAVLDDKTTAICQSLDGVIKPIDDTLWDLYFPPNHWGCRSDVRSLADGHITPINDIVYPDKIPDMFKTNLAKKGMVFPPKHPYFTGLPEHVKEQAQKILNNA
jgi:SPP1 gp7 family putative phage head morphogenesis protein